MKARAETLDGEMVEGYNMYDLFIHSKINIAKDTMPPQMAQQVSQIDPQTLQYQIGSKWYSYNDLQCAVDVWESYTEEIEK